MPTTVGRSRGRQGVHSGAQGAAGDHMPKIMATLITAVVVLVAVLILTKAGRDIDAATQRFMLYYAGVLALVTPVRNRSYTISPPKCYWR